MLNRSLLVSAFPAESGAEMRQSLLSLGTVNKMPCRCQNCWTVARVPCGQTVINMDIHFHYGYLFHLGKRHSKLMKVLLGWKYSFFSRGEQLTESLKQYEYYWDSHGTAQFYWWVYRRVFCLMWSFENFIVLVWTDHTPKIPWWVWNEYQVLLLIYGFL